MNFIPALITSIKSTIKLHIFTFTLIKMANENPIKVNQKEVLTPFNIPQANKNDDISISIDVDLDDDNWKIQPDVQVFLEVDDLYSQSSPLPDGLLIGNAQDLVGKRLLIRSAIVLISTKGAAAGKLPVYNYTLTFKAGDRELEKFSAKSGKDNTTKFNSQSKFDIV